MCQVPINSMPILRPSLLAGAMSLPPLALMFPARRSLQKEDRIKKMLTNPLYYGHFRYAGEVHEGKHTPIITKSLFDRVQATL
ncbi:MAG: recombinase family protein, partial [Candidatus Saccharimonadales bacterium]